MGVVELMPRRYKPMRNVRRVRPFKPMEVKQNPAQARIQAHRAKYPSHVGVEKFVPTCKKPTGQSSEKFTVAIAYNKGAYQVIPAADIKHIGR